ncbi:MAG: molybdopterin-binding protein [Thalassobaculales bacterium]
MTEAPTAAILVIGNEILSGRTRDANIQAIGQRMGELGIRLTEARVVRDEEAAVVAALDALRAANTYVFTTGGIGPTHDDITAACVAKAFGRPLHKHPEAMATLAAHYAANGLPFNEARQKMATVPEGAALIDNPVSKAPGFHIGNVFVLAGIPRVMQAMLDSLTPQLRGGPRMVSATVSCALGEGMLADGLTRLQEADPSVEIGSYPYFHHGRFGVSLVMRGTDPAAVETAAAAVRQLIRDLGGEPLAEDPRDEAK